MTRVFRRAASLTLGGFLLLGAALAGPSSPDTATVNAEDLTPVFAKSCIGYCKHPTNAAKVFRWGLEEWRREFEDRSTHRVQGAWRANRPGLIEQREGMLTINAPSRANRVVVEAADQSARYGRWEARVRAVEESTGNARFAFVWELAPTGESRCGAKNIVLAKYKPGAARARGAVRTAPNNAFRYSRALDLRSRAWHTYAVEVTKTHISWFVDTRVVRTERRDAALSGVRLHPQFQILGSPGSKRNNTSRMQMDWVRYYDLSRPNAKSIKAPQMDRGTSRSSC